MSDLLVPPEGLGVTLEDLELAKRDNLKVRYWPLRDAPCRPHIGHVRGFDELPVNMPRTYGMPTVALGWRVVLWLTGKSGFVCATHCEVVHD
jgi:hypothetical protein